MVKSDVEPSAKSAKKETSVKDPLPGQTDDEEYEYILTLVERLSILETFVVKVIRRLETQFGIDFDGDGKVGIPLDLGEKRPSNDESPNSAAGWSPKKSGFSKLIVLPVLFALLLTSALVFAGVPAQSINAWYDGDDDFGTVKFDTDGVGTATVTADSFNSIGFQEGLSVRSVAKATFNPTNESGVISSAILLGVVLPDNAIIWDGYIDVTTALSSTNQAGATVSVGIGNATNLLAADDITNSFLVGRVALIPDGTVGNSFKTSNTSEVTIAVSVGNITQGVFSAYIEYDIGD